MFRYVDRYSNSLHDLWNNPNRVEELLAALEERDALLEIAVSELDLYLPLRGGTISGALAVGGTLTVTGATTLNGVVTVAGGLIQMTNATSNVIYFPAAGVNPPTFTTRSVGTRLVLWPGLGAASVDYALGITGQTMWYSVPDVNTKHRFYVSTTALIDIYANGALHTLSFPSYGGGWYMQDTTWVRTLADKYVYVGNGWFGTEGGITIGNGGGISGTYKVFCSGSGFFSGNLVVSGTGTVTGQIQTSKNGLGGVWTDASIICNPGAGTSSLALHCGGVAPVIASVNGAGNNVYHRDANFSVGSANAVALAFNIDSTRRIKRNINPWPLRAIGAGTPSATDIVDRLEPVTFEGINVEREMVSSRRANAWHRLNKMRDAKGEPRYELEAHDCGRHDCAGTVDNPCARTLNRRRQRLGFIAEDVFKVLPEAVQIGADGLPESLDIAMLTTAAIAAIKELTARVAQLEGVK